LSGLREVSLCGADFLGAWRKENLSRTTGPDN